MNEESGKRVTDTENKPVVASGVVFFVKNFCESVVDL